MTRSWNQRELAAMRGLLLEALRQLEWAADDDRSALDTRWRYAFALRAMRIAVRKAENAEKRAKKAVWA